MNKNQIAKLVRAYTSGSMNIEHLRGAQMKYARVELLNHITGESKNSGIGDLYAALYVFYGIDGMRMWNMKSNLIYALREAMVDKEAANE